MRKLTYGLAVLAFIALAGCQQGESGESAPRPSTPPTTQQPTQPAAPQATGVREVTTPSGLKYQDLVVGGGPVAADGMSVEVNYTGWLTNGTKFDSSLDPGGRPFVFTLGAGMVIRGWDEGVKGMRVGGKRRLTIPADLAYGEQGSPPVIPANSTLVFEVDFLGVK